MAKSTEAAAPAAPSDLDTLLNLATDRTKTDMGPEAKNKTVNTTVAMTSAVTENGTTTTTSVNAGVSLGTTTTTVKVTDAK